MVKEGTDSHKLPPDLHTLTAEHRQADRHTHTNNKYIKVILKFKVIHSLKVVKVSCENIIHFPRTLGLKDDFLKNSWELIFKNGFRPVYSFMSLKEACFNTLNIEMTNLEITHPKKEGRAAGFHQLPVKQGKYCHRMAQKSSGEPQLWRSKTPPGGLYLLASRLSIPDMPDNVKCSPKGVGWRG